MVQDQGGLLIGEVSQRTGVPIRTIRYYEAKGLLRTDRRPSRYRVFEKEDLVRLKLARCLRRLGFSISETKQALPILLNHRSPDTQRMGKLKAFLEQRLSAAKKELGELAAIHRELEERRKRLPLKGRPSKGSCCEPFCGPETCGPGFIQFASSIKQTSKGGEGR